MIKHLKSIRLPYPKLKYNLAKVQLLSLSLLILLLLVRLYSEKSAIPSDWSTNIRKNCHKWVVKGSQDDPTDLLRSFEDKDFISSFSYVALLGSYLSITFLQPRFFPSSEKVQPDKGYLKIIGRFCVGLSLTLPLYLMSMYLSYL